MNQPDYAKDVAVMAFIQIAHDQMDTLSFKLTEHQITIVKACTDGLVMLQEHYGIFDGLTAHLLKRELDRGNDANLMTCRQILDMMRSDYAFNVFKTLASSYATDKREARLEQAMKAIAEVAAKDQRHEFDNPGLYEVDYYYPPAGIMELIKVRKPRLLPELMGAETHPEQFKNIKNLIVEYHTAVSNALAKNGKYDRQSIEIEI